MIEHKITIVNTKEFSYISLKKKPQIELTAFEETIINVQ